MRNNFNADFPGFDSDFQVGGFFGDITRSIKKAVKNPVIMAAIPVAAVPAALATQKPKNAARSIGKGAALSVSVATGAAALNLSKSNNPIGDAKKIVAAVKNPAVQRAIKNTYQIAKSGDKDAKSTLKLLAATKRAASGPPRKPSLSSKRGSGQRVTGVLIDSRGIVRRGSFGI